MVMKRILARFSCTGTSFLYPLHFAAQSYSHYKEFCGSVKYFMGIKKAGCESPALL
jgi:hypothetical protein